MNTFHRIYRDIVEFGRMSSPRGKAIIEMENYSFTLQPRERFTSFTPRKLNLDYVKEEFLWYLRADPTDALVTESAQMWKDLRQPDGSFLSNYGLYWFNQPGIYRPDGSMAQSGFAWVIDSLLADKDSRQAVIPMLRKEHLYPKNPDIVCTYAVGFRIRNNQLNMSVNMRSQDAVWGMSNDIPCFSFLHEMVYVVLRDTKYYDLRMGAYNHKVDSLHVYERHFEMLGALASSDVEYYSVDCPEIYDANEAMRLIDLADNQEPMSEHLFTAWLQDNRYKRARNETT